jgi:hypothetical protein
LRRRHVVSLRTSRNPGTFLGDRCVAKNCFEMPSELTLPVSEVLGSLH